MVQNNTIQKLLAALEADTESAPEVATPAPSQRLVQAVRAMVERRGLLDGEPCFIQEARQQVFRLRGFRPGTHQIRGEFVWDASSGIQAKAGDPVLFTLVPDPEHDPDGIDGEVTSHLIIGLHSPEAADRFFEVIESNSGIRVVRINDDSASEGG